MTWNEEPCMWALEPLEHLMSQMTHSVVVTADFTTHDRSHIYGLSCPSADSLDPMDYFCTFDASNIIPKNTYYFMYMTFNPFLTYIHGYYP